MKFVLPAFLILLIALSEQERRRTTIAAQAQLAAPREQTRLQWIRSTSLWRFLIRLFEIVSVPVALASFLNAYLGAPFWPVDPEVLTPPPSISYPFDVPFQISNKSGLFPFNSLSVMCVFDYVSAGNKFITNSQSEVAGSKNTLLPNHSDWYICPSHMFLSGSDIVDRAIIHLVLTYDTYWPIDHRSVTTQRYTLDTQSTPPRWLEGDRVY